MTPQLAPARQALLATLAYAVALLTAGIWVAANNGANRDLQAMYAVRTETLDDLKRRRPGHLDKNTSQGADLDAATIAAPSDTIAASTLQRYLLNRLENAGGLVRSVQAEPGRETISPGLQRLGAQLAFDASMVALQHFLFDLETGLPFVFVESIAAQPATTMQPAARAEDRLRVRVTVTSYWKTGEATGTGR